MCEAVGNGIRKKGCVPHAISGTLSVEDSQNLLFVSSIPHFYNISDISKHMPGGFLPTYIQNQR